MAPPKNKTQKMSLGDFLGDQTLGSWADEMEDAPMPSADSRSGYGGMSRGGYGSGGFGGDRGFGSDRPFIPRDELPLPTKPPFTVHLGNLSYDATESDVDGFFSGCAVTSVRIVEDKLDRKPKGFGYVEFSTLDGLKRALELNGSQFQGRNIKISIAEPQKDRLESTRDFGDWSRKGPLPDLPSQGRRTSERGGFRGGYDAGSDAGSESGGRRGFRPDDGKVRDFGNWERKGPLTPAAPSSNDGRRDGPPRERRPDAAWGEGRSQDGSRPPRGEFQEKPQIERAPTAADLDTSWRERMRPDAPSPVATPEASTPSSPAAAPAAPVGRPKLNLQKRTVSDADPTAAASASSDSKASPFGAARPIDTAARERAVEEKRQLAIRQKREADEKAREEKKAKEAAAKAAAVKEKTDTPQSNGKPTAEGENVEGKNAEDAGKTEDAEKTEEGEGQKEAANGETVAAARPPRDNAERPRGGGRGGRPFVPAKRNDGERTWRKPSGPSPAAAQAKAAPTAEPTAEPTGEPKGEPKGEPTAEAGAAPEDDGWSTVQSGKRGGRRNYGRGQAA